MIIKQSTLLLIASAFLLGVMVFSDTIINQRTMAKSPIATDNVDSLDYMSAETPESTCISKVGFTAPEAIDADDPNFLEHRNVGKYPGAVQDQIRNMMDCSFPTQNWSTTQVGDQVNPPYWAKLPEVGVPNTNYPYRPY